MIAWSAPIDLTSAIIMLATLPLVPVFMVLVGWYTERRTSERYAALVRLSTHFLDVVRGLPTLRAFNRGAAQTQRIAEVSDDYRRATMATLRVSFLSGAVLDLAATLGVALIAVTVGVRLVEGDLGLEAGLTVLILAPELYAPLRALGAQYHASADGMAVADRILDLLDEPAAVTSAGDRPAPDLRAVALRLDDVSFAYPARTGEVLRGADLELRPGERVAVVGPSGAGKSTIASLLLRLAEPTGGRVLGGEIDARDTDADAWRAQLAWVPQRPTILRGTVADNIRLGAPDLPEDAVRRAAVAAGADGFVTALPDGYATVVGEGGRALSAGQAQRLALARALARDAAAARPRRAHREPRRRERRARRGGDQATAARPDRPAHRPRPRPDAGDGPRRRAARRAARGRGGGGGAVRDGTLRRLLTLADAPRARLALAVALGALAVILGIGLLALSGYLISRAAEQPPVLSLTVAIVFVRFFGVARPLARYLERITSHDVAFRTLGTLRARLFARIEPLAPAGLASFRRGDLLSRMVADVDALQDLYLRGILPPLVAVIAGAVAVGASAAFVPAAAVVLLAGLLVQGLLVPALARG